MENIARIQTAKPYIPDQDIEEILKNTRAMLKSGRLMQGEFVKKFEEAFAAAIGVKFARALNSGTSGLQAILDYFEVHDREVLVPVNTFLATANAVIYAGGKPVFVDMSRDSLLLDFEDLQRRTTPKTKGVILVHLAGYIDENLEDLLSFCRKKGLFVMEDASHAPGSALGTKKAGSFGDAAAFSLLATKVITSGGLGGMAVSNDEELIKRVTSLRFHGEDSARGVQDRLGYNWCMTELQAIVGLTQLKRLDEIVEKRMKVARAYDEAFQNLDSVKIYHTAEGDTNAYYKYPLTLRPPLRRLEVKERLDKEFAIASGTSYWPPCHLQPAYRKEFGYKEGDYPVAEDVLDRTISLPMFASMTEEEIRRVQEAIITICG